MIVSDETWREMSGWLSEIQKTDPDDTLYDIVQQFKAEFDLDSVMAGKLIARWVVEVT